ncbi:hypothetical protein ABXN37_19910 [Piscinibacter sakaiensis]|uniref:Uncharacterized protein n=1 Tax=Piscinibacter sakaiensis TaxID=1547922 RepID=A0A0K8P456_PISS1|nr:hypothetical protein [Piscinibacter sakaiensis]GAP37391.1 hypothetical protein ISF6_3246 [Piscinibacter sakaiensis]
MRIAIPSFIGEFPRLAPQRLPENAAQVATNARLQSGDLQAWRQYLLATTLANGGAVQTIYRLNGAWLSWEQDVDVARGIVAGDTTFRAYITAPGLYATPRWTNYALATTGAAPYPVTTRPLGVPSPDAAPTLELGIDPTPTTYSIDVQDNGDELAQSWLSSPQRPFSD